MVLPYGTEQGAIALLLQRLDSLVGQRNAGPLEGVEAGIQVDKGEFEAE